MPICPKCERDYSVIVEYCSDCSLKLIPKPESLSSSELYRMACQFKYDEHNYEVANKIFHKVIELFPTSEEAKYSKSQIEENEEKITEEVNEERSDTRIYPPSTPALTIVFNIMGILSIVGGVFCGNFFWTNRYTSTEFSGVFGFSGTVFVIGGIISGCLFFALGQLIKGMNSIEHVIYHFVNKEK